jgi:hypothetical protein
MYLFFLGVGWDRISIQTVLICSCEVTLLILIGQLLESSCWADESPGEVKGHYQSDIESVTN